MADVFEREIVVPLNVDEATSTGAAVVGGVGVGLFDSFEAVSDAIIETRRIRPQPEVSQRYEGLQDVLQNAYQALTDSFRALAAYA